MDNNNICPSIERESIPCTLVPLDEYTDLVESKTLLSVVLRLIRSANKKAKYDSDFKMMISNLLDLFDEEEPDA